MAAPTAPPARQRTEPTGPGPLDATAVDAAAAVPPAASWLRDLEEAEDADDPDAYGPEVDDAEDETAVAEDPEDSDELVEEGDLDDVDGYDGLSGPAVLLSRWPRRVPARA